MARDWHPLPTPSRSAGMFGRGHETARRLEQLGKSGDRRALARRALSWNGRWTDCAPGSPSCAGLALVGKVSVGVCAVPAAFVSGPYRGVCVQMVAASIETTPGIGRVHRLAVADVRPPEDFDGMLQFVCDSN